MVQKGRNANGTTTTSRARHIPHNNIDNINTLYIHYITINKQHTINNKQKRTRRAEQPNRSK